MFGDENKEHGDVVSKKLLSLAQYVLLGATGLLPLFFLPTFAAPLGYTKIIMFSVGLMLALVFFAFSVLRRGTLSIQFPFPMVLLWAVFIVASASALFSGDVADSFWGTEVTQHSAIFMGIMALALSMWNLIGSRKDMIIHLYLMLAFGALALALFHIIRIIAGVDVLALGIFGGNAVLSPFGEWNSLAIFYGLVVIFSLVALEQLSLNKGGRYFFAGVVAISLVMLAVINFIAVFVVLALVGLVTIVYALTKGKFNSTQIVATTTHASTVSIVCSFATLLVSIVFLVGGSAVGGGVSKLTGISHIEVRPSFAATIDIAKKVYEDNLVLGVGPNRFTDAWRIHRDPSINTTIFWNTGFEAGYGYIPTLFVTMGLLGGLVWLGFLGAFFYTGIRTLIKNTQADHLWYFIALSSFVASVYLWLMSILYVSGPVLLLLAAVCSGIFLSARRVMNAQGTVTVSFMQQQHAAFVAISLTVLVVVSAVGSVYFMGRHFTAVMLFRGSIMELQTGKAEEGLAGMLRAYQFSKDDLFVGQFSAYKLDMLRQISSGEVNADTQKLFQKTFDESRMAGDEALLLDPTNPENYTNLGRLYATIVGINNGTSYPLALENLKKAQELDPKNPSRFVALAELELLQNKTAEARTYINQAIALKQNYTDAFYILAQIEIAEGNVNAAVTSTRATVDLDGQNPVRHFQLGVLLSAAKDINGAAAAFERARDINKDYSNARYFLAFAYDALDRKADAIRELEEVLSRNQGNTEVETLIRRLKANEDINELAKKTTATSTVPVGNPLPENSESTDTREPVTSGKAPNSPLLSPVNTDTTTNSDAQDTMVIE